MSIVHNQTGHAAGEPSMSMRSHVAVTPTSWDAQRPLSIGEWAAQGKRLGVMGRGTGWWIGDWLRYGNEKFGEKYTRAAKLTGYDTQTLMNMVYVASRFDFSRRREELSWSHHAEVAALDLEQQDVWLTRAMTDRLSVRALREELTLTRGAASRLRQKEDRDRVQVICPACGSSVPISPSARRVRSASARVKDDENDGG